MIEGLSQDLTKQGFSLKLKIPNTNINKIFEYSDFSIEQDIKVETRYETYWEKRDSWWASFTNWLNDDWGKDEKVRQVEEYIIDKTKIKGIVDIKMRSVLTSYKNKTNEEIINPLNKEVDCFFEEVKKVLIKIQSDFEQGIKDKQKSQNEISDLLTNMNVFLEQTKKASHDSESLLADIDQLKQCQ